MGTTKGNDTNNDDLGTPGAVTDRQQIPTAQVLLPGQTQQQSETQLSAVDKTATLNLKNLKIPENSYNYEGNKIIGSPLKYESKNSDGSGLSQDLLEEPTQNKNPNTNKKIPNSARTKDNIGFSNDGGVAVGIANRQLSPDNMYGNNDQRDIKKVPSIEEQKRLYALQELEKALQPKKPMTLQQATRKYLAQKYSDRENSFSTRMISSLDEMIGYEIDYYDEGNNAYLSRPKWLVFVSVTLAVMFGLSILAIIYFHFIKPVKANKT